MKTNNALVGRVGLTLLKIKDVSRITGRCRAGIYEDVADGLLPRQVHLSARSVGWPEHEVQHVVAARIAGWTDEQVRALVKTLEVARGSLIENRFSQDTGLAEATSEAKQ